MPKYFKFIGAIEVVFAIIGFFYFAFNYFPSFFFILCLKFPNILPYRKIPDSRLKAVSGTGFLILPQALPNR